MVGNVDKRTQHTDEKRNVVSVKKASAGDLDTLVSMTRVCFPDEIAWNVRPLAAKFWKGVLESPSCETWIWIVGNSPAAFCHLVVDVEMWAGEKPRYDYGLATKLWRLIANPDVLIRKIKKKLNPPQAEDIYKPSEDASMKENYERCAGFMSSTLSSNETLLYGGLEFNPSEVMWVERAGVLPEYRKHALAIRVIQFSNKRAKELQRSAVCGMIEMVKKPWCFLHERFGYGAVHYDKGRYTFLKVL